MYQKIMCIKYIQFIRCFSQWYRQTSTVSSTRLTSTECNARTGRTVVLIPKLWSSYFIELSSFMKYVHQYFRQSARMKSHYGKYMENTMSKHYASRTTSNKCSSGKPQTIYTHTYYCTLTETCVLTVSN